jgi:hypothetical protein
MPATQELLDIQSAVHARMRGWHAAYPLLRQQLLLVNVETRRPEAQPGGHWAAAVRASGLSERFTGWGRAQLRWGMWLWEALTVGPLWEGAWAIGCVRGSAGCRLRPLQAPARLGPRAALLSRPRPLPFAPAPLQRRSRERREELELRLGELLSAQQAPQTGAGLGARDRGGEGCWRPTSWAPWPAPAASAAPALNHHHPRGPPPPPPGQPTQPRRFHRRAWLGRRRWSTMKL